VLPTPPKPGEDRPDGENEGDEAHRVSEISRVLSSLALPAIEAIAMLRAGVSKGSRTETPRELTHLRPVNVDALARSNALVAAVRRGCLLGWPHGGPFS
jgi:hypothetical protein